MTQVLIDTDVILDFFFDRQPFAENASKIFSLSESKKIISFVTPVIISNVYYLLRQTATHEKVIEKLTSGKTVFGIESSAINEGATANISLFNPEGESTFTKAAILSKSKNSAFLGKAMKGKAIGIYNQGKLVLSST